MSYQENLYVNSDKKANRIVSHLPRFCKQYFDHLKNINRSQRTRVQYAYDLQRFFEYLLKQKLIKKIDYTHASAEDVLGTLTLNHLQGYINSLEYYKSENKLKVTSPSAKARKVSSVKSFFKYYYRVGAIQNNPADLLESPKIPEKQLNILNRKEILRMLKIIQNSKEKSPILGLRNYAITMLFLGTGIRLSELVGINISDIDFEESSVLVTRKGGDLDIVYYGPEVKQALKDYIQNSRESLLTAKSDSSALFISNKHNRISIRAVEDMINSFAKKAGISGKVSPHTLRRSYGTYLYNATGDIYLVASVLHHSSVETARKHYVRMSDNHKKIAAKKSSELFSKL